MCHRPTPCDDRIVCTFGKSLKFVLALVCAYFLFGSLYSLGQADIGQEIMNLQASLPSTGGSISLRMLTGNQVCNTAVNLYPNVTLELYPGTHISGNCQISMGAYSAIVGVGANGAAYIDDASQITWQYTGAGNHITIQSLANGVKLSGITFIGNLQGGASTGSGLFVSPGPSPGTNYVINLNLDHVQFRHYPQDGIHLEDNTYLINCYSCGAEYNGRYGWFQGSVNSNIPPVEINLFDAVFARNAVSQVYVGNGQFRAFGGTISDELHPAGTNYCVDFPDTGTNNQTVATLIGVHIEGCGGQSGGAFINWNAYNGIFTLRDVYFVIAEAPTTDAILIGPNAGGTISIGPGNVPASGGRYFINNTTANLGSTISVYDPVPPSAIGSINYNMHFWNSMLADSHYLYGFPEFLVNGAAFNTIARISLRDGSPGGTDEYLQSSNGGFQILDNNGNGQMTLTDDVFSVTPPLSRLRVANGVSNQAGIQMFAQALCTTGSTIGSHCDTTVTYPVVEPDTQYVLTCTLNGTGSGSQGVISYYNPTTTGAVLRLTTVTYASQSGIANCILHHN